MGRRKSSNKYIRRSVMKIKLLLCVMLAFLLLLIGCGSDANNENVEEVEVMISVQRTGNILTNIGDLEVWIDGEKVFTVDGNSTNSVNIKMLEGEHIIQTKGQGDKSKKVKFDVTQDSENEFYFTTEISNWYGVKLEERNYIPEE